MTMRASNSSCFATLVAAVLSACLLFSAPARAEQPDVSAAEHVKRAQVAYYLQDYKTVIAEYQAAYRLEQKNEYLWAIAQAQRVSGDCKTAIKSYKAYAANATKPSQVTAAEGQIAQCEGELAKQTEAASSAAAAAAAKPASAAEASPKAAREPAKAETAKRTQSPDRASPSPFYSDMLGNVLTLGGVASAAVGTVFLLEGREDANDTSGSYDEVVARRDDARREMVLGAGGLVLGGTLIVSGVVRYALFDRSEPRPASDSGPKLSATLGRRTASVNLGGTF